MKLKDSRNIIIWAKETVSNSMSYKDERQKKGVSRWRPLVRVSECFYEGGRAGNGGLWSSCFVVIFLREKDWKENRGISSI